jgi:5-methylcytosine-specific restriction endonuclease McrA
LTDCSLLHEEGCEMCGADLTGRQRRFCSRQCARDFVANHRWTQARAKAKKAQTYFMCARAIPTNEGFIGGDSDCLIFTTKPEVNHIVPCKGKHGTWGCHHHQENLEVLCRPCHLKETARQRQEGLI